MDWPRKTSPSRLRGLPETAFSKRDGVGWLASSCSRGAVGKGLEDAVGAEGVVIVLALVARQDAVDPAADHLQEAVLGEVGGAGVVQGGGESPGEPDKLVELANGQEPGVAGELTRLRLRPTRCKENNDPIRS
jgi:hypothetical protein